MIEGFKVTITAAEMKHHLHTRAKHHEERAKWYENQRATFADAPTAQMTQDPVAGLKEAGKRHEQKSSWFNFMAEHVPAGETYLLNDHDLERLEMVQAKGY